MRLVPCFAWAGHILFPRCSLAHILLLPLIQTIFPCIFSIVVTEETNDIDNPVLYLNNFFIAACMEADIGLCHHFVKRNIQRNVKYCLPLSPTFRLEVMSLLVDCIFQASYHKTCVQYGITAKDARFMVTHSEVCNLHLLWSSQWSTQSIGSDIASDLEIGQRAS